MNQHVRAVQEFQWVQQFSVSNMWMDGQIYQFLFHIKATETKISKI